MRNKLISISDCYNGNIAELFTLDFQAKISLLHAEFDVSRRELLKARDKRQERFDAGEVPTFESNHPAKNTDWRVATIPADLLDRRVEITGPINNPKMVINMLSENQNGDIACTAMLDFEDSMAPTWQNVVSGYKNIISVAAKNLTYAQTDENGKQKFYQLNSKKMAHPMVRVRGLHMDEKNFCVGGEAVSAGLLDLFTTAYHTSKLFLQNKMTPKFYVPKCEHYLEARWWNEVFSHIEQILEFPIGTLKVTFLIETLPAAFQMEEILYEIRERACGLNGGRWDKIFSDIKTLKLHSDRILPDRSTIDMKKPWMDNYAKLLIKTCHKHGAFAMGGMSAFTPGADEATRKIQLEKVEADKKREATIGHDGCWVSHPFFISMAKKQFNSKNQLDVQLNDFSETPELLPSMVGPRTIEGLRQNIRVGIAYQQGWTEGLGCIAFENLMEDLATLEISRAQVWQWVTHQVILENNSIVSRDLVRKLFDEECETILANLKIDPNSKLGLSYVTAKEQMKEIYLKKDLANFYTEINTQDTQTKKESTYVV